MGDVVIVGAGPTGLWLAGELRLGGATVTVLEARAERDPNSKALTIHPRTIEILDTRGVVEPFLAEGVRIPDGHFGGLPDRMDFAALDTPYPYTLALPQARTEELLEARARQLGATIRRGCRVTGLAGHGVVLESGEVVAARYVAGCDGVRSTVRAAAGIAFPGTGATTWGWLGDVVLDAPPEGGVATIAGPRGGLMVVPLGAGVSRLVGADPSTARPQWPGELTLDELRATVRRIAGTDFGMRDPIWLSRFGNATRQAATYRRGRVLLAGDAAHQHFPTGGVGMNVGIQDAHNLGWKLAAVLTGRAGDALLDTYHEERHPVGAALLAHTRAQTALMTAYTPEGQALRALLSGLITTAPDMSRQLAERLSGLDVTYPTGRRVGNLSFPDGTTLFQRLRGGRHVETEVGLVRPDGHLAHPPGGGARIAGQPAE
ncbi:FAD-dependent monooxygenase [Actinoplanes teichomyceticus]|uniref:2-polyprenyl-6-methoxyphenol hydroxylase-like FAD-dependent oxidoreductase n=1 Tax=Actinoplanes teichomyceticus TaxID=1867 RepID=A0A561VR62_ACTTI|nr:FAD-dependent monooxygenase [Actinoplanes teichomyceticus]TWG14102.1 2-polyprenyl-6-methoxyphenol hydroxylase-like FAD-dependent oxidoreductase [Actinoplanes teichomyceticus]GIF13337.1 putative aromatic compound monooxygenase YhjG [Actinoplanes teichomyceticus]